MLGITLPTEYVTGCSGDFPHTLKTVIIREKKSIQLEPQPLFLGYKLPLLAVMLNQESPDPVTPFGIFGFELHNEKSQESFGNILGRTSRAFTAGKQQFCIFQPFFAEQFIEREIHQTNRKIISFITGKKHIDLGLYPVQYDFLKMAYSTPREIRLVTISNESTFNLFPIDLFGYVGEDHLILSLRHDRRTCRQVEECKQIATWMVDAKYAAEVYSLGKNHSTGCVGKSALSINDKLSPAFGLPGPTFATDPEEFELTERIGDFGMHRLLLFRRVGTKISPRENCLVHIHRCYAELLLKHGFQLKHITR